MGEPKWRWSEGKLSAKVGRLTSNGDSVEAVVLSLSPNLQLWCVYQLDATGHEVVLEVGGVPSPEAAMLVAQGRGRRRVVPPRPRRDRSREGEPVSAFVCTFALTGQECDCAVEEGLDDGVCTCRTLELPIGELRQLELVVPRRGRELAASPHFFDGAPS